MKERYFPIGIQSFEQLRKYNAIYVDKTALIYRLVSTGRYYFLSRPRRFGKSLLVSTLAAYFEGRKDLFDGLRIAELEKDWIKYPVLHFDLSRSKISTPENMINLLDSLLSRFESVYGGGSAARDEFGLRLSDLIMAAKKKFGQNVVVLIDEYDAPLLDTMHNKDLFADVRQQLRKFFSPLKEADDNLCFVFITGISKFSQLSIFSELNNLTTITMNSEFAAICGITKEELVEQLEPEIEVMAEKLGISAKTVVQRLRKKYDGYHFTEDSPDIFNPFSLLNSLREKKFKNYWYSTGTPTHLTQMLSQYSIRPEELEGFSATLSMFDIPLEQASTPLPMLYQSGYLTIKSCRSTRYTLGFPNEEVRLSFLQGLMPYYSKKIRDENEIFLSDLTLALEEHDVDRSMNLLRSFFSSIPYDTEKQDEDHYKTMFYLIFRLASAFEVRTEERSAAGRCDALIETEDTIYLFEFKLDGTAEEALKQIDDKGYAIQYEAGDKKIVKVGVNFEKDKRTIERWVVG